jgi:hypothetical protein
MYLLEVMYNLEVSCVSLTRGAFSCVHVGPCVCPVSACLCACACVLSVSCVGMTGWEIGFVVLCCAQRSVSSGQVMIHSSLS